MTEVFFGIVFALVGCAFIAFGFAVALGVVAP